MQQTFPNYPATHESR